MAFRPWFRFQVVLQDGLQTHTTNPPASIPVSAPWTGPPYNNAPLEIFYKFHHRLVTIDSTYLLKRRENRMNDGWNRPAVRHPAPTGPSTGRSRSFLEPHKNQTAWRRR